MNNQNEYVSLSVADGTSMRAYISRPPATPRGGLIVFQEAFGVNAHMRDVTDRFAREGYLCITSELFHRTAPGLEAGYTDFPAVIPHMHALTDEGLAADMMAAYDWLKKKSGSPDLSTSAIGYCMGGRTACLAAMTLPLACCTSYYGGGIAGNQIFPSLLDRFSEISAPVLYFWGGLDAHIGPDQVKAVNDGMRAAKKTWINVEFSFADHGFFCDARASYNAEAAAEAWALTLTFLNTHAGAK
jgi:carboxymethylenebutenolidase